MTSTETESDIVLFMMKPLAIFAISVVGFILIFRTKSKRRPADYYTNPDWNFFLKKWWAQREITDRIKKEQSSFMRELKHENIESPRPLETESSSDSQLIFGQDSQGNSLLIKLTRRRHRIAEVWLVLRLKDGREFSLPDHPDTQVFNVNAESFSAAGLTMDCLVPFQTWRIRFNGFLRKGVRSEWTTDLKEEELVSVKFNFLWLMKTKPLYWPFDWSVQLMATGIATEAWRDGNWMRMLEKVDSGGYDQYGAMLGQIFIEGTEKETLEVNLPGLRQRRWGPAKIAHLRRSASIIGVCKNGMVFNVGAFSSKEGLTHVQFGNVILPCGLVKSIDWTDFHLRDFAEHRHLRDAQLIRFGVSNQQFTVVIHFKQSSKIPLFGGRPLDWHSDIYQMEITVNGEDGKGIGMFWYPSDGNETPLIPHIPHYRRVHYSSAKPKPDRFVYHFTEEAASSVSISGGKGASLALLTAISKMPNIVDRLYANDQLFKDHRHEHLAPTRKQSISQISSPDFLVPSGFILSVSAMELMVKSSSAVDSNISKLEKLCANGQGFKEQCEVVQKSIINLQLASEIVSEILKALRFIGSSEDNLRIAVRSSSVCEDGEDVSAAGQNESFLGLRSDEEILEAIKQCWASLYSYQSVQYRKQNIQPIRTGMAVVVQTMLAADCAGVLFSQHPITGDVKQCLISANYGLGETVVSGEVDPDNYVVQRNYTDDKLTVVEKVKGEKGYKIQMSEDNSVEKVKVEDQEFCLTEEVVLKLAEIGVILEKLYGNGRDIEWGLKENRIYLLQSRPITSLNQFSDWELIHEFDTATMSEEELNTTANIQEVAPGTMCPLSMDVLGSCIEQSISDQLDGKDRKEVDYNRLFTIARHHMFMNVYKLFFRSKAKEIKMDQRVSSIAVCGYDMTSPLIHRIASKRFWPYSKSDLTMLLKILLFAWHGKKNAKKGMALAKSFNSQYSPQNLVYFATAKELLANLESQFPVMYTISDLHCAMSSVSTFSNLITMMILMEGQKEMTDDHHSDFRLICSSAKDTESAEVPKKLEEMAKGIFLSGKKDQFCTVNPDEGGKWLEKNLPEVSSIFVTFIEQNKHRGFKEFNLSSETWGMRPGIIIDMLQALLKFTENVESISKVNSVVSMTPAELVTKLKTPKSAITRMILRRTIKQSQIAVQRREQTKSNFISINHELRLGFQHLGNLMAKEGYLPSPDLVFYLNIRELKFLLKTRDVQLTKKAMRRQKLSQELDKERYSDLMWGLPEPINKKKVLKFESGTEIRGTAVYAGVVTGRACVIHHFSEVNKIQPGDILITYCTDIGWSPYFPILGGVVTEIGGLISHGAVVAREYGLPCIVAAAGATDFFTFGETITLDAKTGVIFKGDGS